MALCVSCASSPDVDAHRLALWNFHYEADKDNEYRVYNSISTPFYGDCEDFAFTLAKQIGGEVWYIDTGTYPAHAALVKGGWVYDSIYTRRVSKQNYKGEFKFIMRAE